MKHECGVVQDLLPLYVEGMTRPDTREFVEEHLQTCESCRTRLAELQGGTALPAVEGVPLQQLRKELWHKRLQASLLAAVVAVAVLCGVWGYITAPSYLSLEEASDGIGHRSVIRGNGMNAIIDSDLVISFRPGVVPEVQTTGENGRICHIAAYTNLWEQWHATEYGREFSTETLPPASSVYFSANDGTASKLLYGADIYPDGEVVSLPRLALWYYLLAAAVLAAVLGLAWIWLRKTAAAGTLQKLFWLPVCYVAGHLLIKGPHTASYSLQRDFCLIVLAALLLYTAIRLGGSLWRYKHPKPE